MSGADRAGARLGRLARAVALSWRRLGFQQRIAGVAATLLVVSTFGPFSFVEAAQLLVALGVLALLHARARGKRFHLPFGDGTVVLAAGCWAAMLIVVRLLDRPLGQNLLALGCAALLALAGLAERRARPPDDLPPEEREPGLAGGAPTGGAAADAPTRRLPVEARPESGAALGGEGAGSMPAP